MTLPTASSVGDLFACAWQFRDGLELIEDESGEGADTGTYVHSLVEANLNGICDPVAVPPKANVSRAAIIVDRFIDWWETGNANLPWQTEAPYAISLSSGVGRRLPSNGPRDYSAATADEIAGTADLIAITSDAVVIYDIKTTLRPEYTTEAPSNKQLLTLALAATRAHDRDRARVGLLFANEYEVRLETAEFDALDLDMFESELRIATASIPTSDPASGRHCRFCKARAVCSSVPRQYQIRRVPRSVGATP